MIFLLLLIVVLQIISNELRAQKLFKRLDQLQFDIDKLRFEPQVREIIKEIHKEVPPQNYPIVDHHPLADFNKINIQGSLFNG